MNTAFWKVEFPSDATLLSDDSLEAATSRLEDITVAQQSQQVIGTIPGPSIHAAPSASAPPPASGPSAPGGGAAAQDDAKVQGYKDLVEGALKKYEQLSDELGGLVAEQVSACFGLPW